MARTGTETFRLRQQDLAWRLIEAEAIVLDNRTSRYLSVNRTGAVLWQLLSEGTSYERMVSQLVDRYGVAVDQARADVDGFLADCAGRGLLDGWTEPSRPATAGAVGRYRPAPLEILAGTLLGDDPGVSPLDARPRGVPPGRALEDAMAPALQRPPCLVSFSGGRDSSIILAVATSLARRDGLTLPVPVTLRFPGHDETREDEWQEMVIRHLDLPDWVRLPFGDELDGLGPVAGAALRRHGVLTPSNWYLHRPMLEPAAGGSLLTGVGGDELFASPGSLTLRLRAGSRRGLPRRLARAGLLAAPRTVRRRVERSGGRGEYAWLRPAARAAVRAALVRDWVAEPLRWDAAVRSWWRSRAFQSQRHVLAALGHDLDVLTVHPFLDPDFLAELAPVGGIKGFADRSAAIEQLFGGLLPGPVVHRSTKASFGQVCFGPITRAFVSAWDGAGIDTATVDHEAVVAEWSSARPDARSQLLLQSVWLATTGQGPRR